jgi:hypothetical protein
MRLVAQNFARVCTAPATSIGVTPLIAMVDCEQEDAAHKYVVASKHVGPDYSTTVYDVRAGRLYRARHVCGMRGVWKDIASRRAHVQLLGKHDVYLPPDAAAAEPATTL